MELSSGWLGRVKATFLVYVDLEGKPLSELRQSIKLTVRTRWVQVFDHSGDAQLLFFEERFVSNVHPKRREMEALATKLRKLEFAPASVGTGPLKRDFVALLALKGLNENLNARRRTRSSSPSA